MTITVNCNDDTITIDKIEMPCKHPYQTSKILEEILNKVFDIIRFAESVELIRIDEDTRRTIGEW